MIRIAYILFATILFAASFSSCRYNEHTGRSNDHTASSNLYARGFTIESHKDFRILYVRDPWQKSQGIQFRYILCHDTGLVPDSLQHLPCIQTPVNRVICMSTTHIAMIDALGRTNTIVGISGPDYVSNPELRKKIEEGDLPDVGADRALNYEHIISLKPDLVMSYGVGPEVSGMVSRLGGLGIPVILDADYLENEPLGKTEWIRFVAEFYDLGESADSIFVKISDEYNTIKSMATGAESRPRVMTGLPWKDVWYIPGGNSYAASFIRDAGGEYVWGELESREAAPADLESVYVKAGDADIWINSGSALSLEEIRNTEERLEEFSAFKFAKVYNNTARLNPAGGNDFWETGVMEPQLVLADLVYIFHPGLIPGHRFRYYEQLY